MTTSTDAPACAAIRGLAPPRHVIRRDDLPSLALSLVPGVIFTLGLVAASVTPRFTWLASPSTWPWQLHLMALAGGTATVAGALDWTYHRMAGITLGKAERRAERMALGLGGVPLFVLMVGASLGSTPTAYLIPVFVVLVATTAMIAYDEIAFHTRRCAPVEQLMHRLLTGGHFIAFLAWAHLVFVSGMPGVSHG